MLLQGALRTWSMRCARILSSRNAPDPPSRAWQSVAKQPRYERGALSDAERGSNRPDPISRHRARGVEPENFEGQVSHERGRTPAARHSQLKMAGRTVAFPFSSIACTRLDPLVKVIEHRAKGVEPEDFEEQVSHEWGPTPVARYSQSEIGGRTVAFPFSSSARAGLDPLVASLEHRAKGVEPGNFKGSRSRQPGATVSAQFIESKTSGGTLDWKSTSVARSSLNPPALMLFVGRSEVEVINSDALRFRAPAELSYPMQCCDERAVAVMMRGVADAFFGPRDDRGAVCRAVNNARVALATQLAVRAARRGDSTITSGGCRIVILDDERYACDGNSNCPNCSVACAIPNVRGVCVFVLHVWGLSLRVQHTSAPVRARLVLGHSFQGRIRSLRARDKQRAIARWVASPHSREFRGRGVFNGRER